MRDALIMVILLLLILETTPRWSSRTSFVFGAIALAAWIVTALQIFGHAFR